MKRVEIIICFSGDKLEKAVNDWIEDHPDNEVHDIKFDIIIGTQRYYSEYGAMIIYS